MGNMEFVILNNIKNAHINLCAICKYHYPECPADAQDVLFGNFYNVCACAKYGIIRCKDCLEWQEYDGVNGELNNGWCEINDKTTYYLYFCADGGYKERN